MIPNRRYALRIAGLLAGMAVSLFAGPFLPPAEGPAAFRLDKIPLDREALEGLSKQLTTLAREFKPETPAARRGAAQMLALSLTLAPLNPALTQTARNLLDDYQKDRRKGDANDAQLENCRAGIEQYVAWLESPEAGSDGQALANCLKDVLTISDPEHPEEDEVGKWAGWVPELSAYEAQLAKNGNQGADRKGEILLSKAEVHAVLWRKNGKNEPASWVLAVVPLQMSAIKVGEDKGWKPPLSIAVGAAQDAESFKPTNTMLLNLLKKQQENLPVGYKIAITCRELEESVQSRKRQSLSAAAAVLASSAITGRDPEAIIIGQVDENGEFKLPTGFWDQLMALGKGNGQRLVLPAAAAASVPSLLVLGRPGFFLEYEVLLAKDFRQLLELSAKTPDESLAKANKQFHEIRDRQGSQEIRQYIDNRFVRQRLAEMQQEYPYHISAKMLWVQATGKRPTLLTRAVLAAELRRAIEPMDWLVRTAELVYAPWENGGNGKTTEFTAADIARFAPSMESCRSRLDALEQRSTDKNDRDLVDRTRKSVIAIRGLDKAARTRGASYQVTAAVHTACGEFLNNYKELSKLLAHETGEQ